MEIWKDIRGFEGVYQISNLGRVKSLRRVKKRSDGIKHTTSEKILKVHKNQKGYLFLSLVGEKKKMYKVHRLVAKTYIPNHGNKPCVNHVDGEKANNSVENLEWVTYSENSIHAYGTGLKKSPSGEQHWTTRKTAYKKLSDEKVLEIKSKLDKGRTQTALAEEYGVVQSTVWTISKGNRSILKKGWE